MRAPAPPAPQAVTATNNAGVSASASFTVTPDTTAPSGGALTVNGTTAAGGGSSSYNTSGSFTIGARTDYAETQSATQSGLASSTLTVAAAHAVGQLLRQLRRAEHDQRHADADQDDRLLPATR